MTKKEFLKLNSLAWDYNKSHREKKVHIMQQVGTTECTVAFFDYPECKMIDLVCTKSLSTQWNKDEIMEDMGK